MLAVVSSVKKKYTHKEVQTHLASMIEAVMLLLETFPAELPSDDLELLMMPLTLRNATGLGKGSAILSFPSIETTSDMLGLSSALS